MFSSLRKERRPLQLYGKLPIAKDYLRIGCGQGSAAAWRSWLDRAFSPTGTQSSAPLLLWPARYVYQDDEHAPVLGTAWPSSDAGGLRKFPFSLLVERRPKALLKDTWRGFPRGATLWGVLRDLYARRSRHEDARDYISAMRSEELVCDPVDEKEAKGADFHAWTQSLFPAGRDGLEELLSRMCQLDRDGFRGPYRLPLAAGLPVRDQVHAWLTALSTLELLDTDRQPTLVFPDAERVAYDFDKPLYLMIVRSRPTPDLVPWLTLVGDEPLFEGDFVCTPTKAEGVRPPSSESVPPLADSLRGLVMRIKGRTRSS